MQKNKYHEPVLKEEIVKIIEETKSGKKRIIDATLGTAGHTLEFLKKGWEVLAIEADENMLEIASKRIIDFSQNNFLLVNDNFRYIDRIAKDNNFTNCDSVVFDLGVSNFQLTSKKRGFSFSNPDADLDMRLDPKNQKIKASDLLNILREDQLRTMFVKVLKNGLAKKLACEVVNIRKQNKFETVGDFLAVCNLVSAKKGLNKATLPFLALRIAVNSEFENLSEALPKALNILKTGGRLIVISFHSGEDGIVKDYFKSFESKSLAKLFEVLIPSKNEIGVNPRSRSAKLRYLEKL